MADEDTTTKLATSESDSETFEEASTTSVSDQLAMLGRTDPSVSVAPTTEAISSETEIKEVAGTSSNIIEPFSGESSSTPITSQTVADVQEDEQQPADDDPSAPLIPPRYRDGVPAITVVDYGTYEPPPPPRPSLIQCLCCCFITTYCIHYTRKIRNSKYMILVLIALLAMPISAFYFGIAYIGSCPMAEFSPIILIIMGIAGIFFIGVRLMTISIRRGVWNTEIPPPPTILFVAITVMLMVLMPMEMVNFYTKKPVFDNSKDRDFCEKTYYYYVFYMNFVVLIIGILALLLHLPMKPRNAVQVVPQEHFDTV